MATDALELETERNDIFGELEMDVQRKMEGEGPAYHDSMQFYVSTKTAVET